MGDLADTNLNFNQGINSASPLNYMIYFSNHLKSTTGHGNSRNAHINANNIRSATLGYELSKSQVPLAFANRA